MARNSLGFYLPYVALKLKTFAGFWLPFLLTSIAGLVAAPLMVGVPEGVKTRLPRSDTTVPESFLDKFFEPGSRLASAILFFSTFSGPAATTFVVLYAKELGIGGQLGRGVDGLTLSSCILIGDPEFLLHLHEGRNELRRVDGRIAVVWAVLQVRHYVLDQRAQAVSQAVLSRRHRDDRESFDGAEFSDHRVQRSQRLRRKRISSASAQDSAAIEDEVLYLMNGGARWFGRHGALVSNAEF